MYQGAIKAICDIPTQHDLVIVCVLNASSAIEAYLQPFET